MATTPPRVSIEDSNGSRGSENDGGEEVSRKEGSEISPEILKENGGVVKVWSADDGGPNVGGRMTSEAEASVSLSEYQIVNDKEELIPRKMQLGKSESEASVKGKEVVLKLLDDLEKVEVISRSALVATGDSQSHVEACSSGLSVSQKEGDWSLNGRPVSPRRLSQTMPVGGVESPNGFQVLGNIREEGGIVDEEKGEEETALQEEDEDRVHDPFIHKDREGAGPESRARVRLC
ncbi:hypothetical protein F2Q69_00056627 [Brassica cretica]|uniref:Uncharacterized protein n=1 Tax=Brassica cretica TaxID=69181 RepID=A0A8S9MU26_BRACR|nr:hypothetical protein F2Q69_00056627 [Brassica cretica]